MASEALQNQVLIDQMFARSLSPISTGLEQQRQFAEQQLKYRQALAQRQAELDQEFNFRARQSQLALEANAALAREQQRAIAEREAAQFGRTTAYGELQALNQSGLFTPEELRTFSTDEKARQGAMAELRQRRNAKDKTALDTLDQEYRQVGRQVVEELSSAAKILPPTVREAATTSWLAAQSPEMQKTVMNALRRAGQKDLTPEVLDQIVRENRGLFGTGAFGLKDSESVEAVLSFRSALNEAALKNGQAPIGAQLALERLQNIKSLRDGIQTRNPDAATDRAMQLLEEDKKRVASILGANPVQTEPVQTPVLDKPAPAPVSVAPGTDSYGGLIGAGSNFIQGIPANIAAAGDWLANKNAAAANLIGGEKLRQQAVTRDAAALQALSSLSDFYRANPGAAIMPFAPGVFNGVNGQ